MYQAAGSMMNFCNTMNLLQTFLKTVKCKVQYFLHLYYGITLKTLIFVRMLNERITYDFLQKSPVLKCSIYVCFLRRSTIFISMLC